MDIAGSRQNLADVLRISLTELDAYLEGRKAVPDAVFHAALDIVARGRHAPK